MYTTYDILTKWIPSRVVGIFPERERERERERWHQSDTRITLRNNETRQPHMHKEMEVDWEA